MTYPDIGDSMQRFELLSKIDVGDKVGAVDLRKTFLRFQLTIIIANPF